MMWEQRAVVPLRICLVVLFGILVVFQTFSLPGQFRYMAQEHPEDADLRWPLTAIAVFLVLCVQVVVVATWKLLGLVSADRIFTRDSLVWVNAILGALAAAWLVLLAIFLWVGFQADDPGVPMLLFLLLVAGAVLGLLMVVMRALLRQATTLRTDMDAVI
jgi:DUF2975 family protein